MTPETEPLRKCRYKRCRWRLGARDHRLENAPARKMSVEKKRNMGKIYNKGSWS